MRNNKITGKLASKMVLVFSVVILSLITALIAISYRYAAGMIKDDYINGSETALELASQAFDNYLAELSVYSMRLRNDEHFMDAITTGVDSYADMAYIENAVVNLYYSRNDIMELRFDIIAQGIGYRKAGIADPGFYNFDGAELKNNDWYKAMIADRHYSSISLPESETGGFITYHRAIIKISDKTPIAVLSITLNSSGYDKIIDKMIEKDGETFIIMDESKTVFFTNNSSVMSIISDPYFKEKIGKQPSKINFTIQNDNTNYIVIYKTSANNGWTLLKMIPFAVLNRKAVMVRNLSILVGVFFLILFIVIVILVSGTITKPLRQLSRQMEIAGEGSMDVSVSVKGGDEVAQLANKFNLMIKRIDTLIKEEYVAELSERNALLKALMAQINPHFLHNTLQVISTEALKHGDKDIVSMISALSDILRYSIKGPDTVSIEVELQHVKKYLFLQKARYEDRLNVKMDIDEAVMDISIPKLSLQTLVENSIVHGLEQTKKSVMIVIQIRKARDGVHISVSDDGPGVPPARLEEIRRELSEMIGIDDLNQNIGLRNLNSRLKIIYGDKAYLNIDSVFGEGTKADIFVPV